jgi:hypothetical protein
MTEMEKLQQDIQNLKTASSIFETRLIAVETWLKGHVFVGYLIAAAAGFLVGFVAK